jgi:RNA polymerase sigma-70 factor (ECF subfamily)
MASGLAKPSLVSPSRLHTDESAAISDAELMRLVASGQHDALTSIFDRYYRLVFSVAIRIVRDPGEAEEVVQTVFLDIFKSAAKFDPAKGILKVWLLQYAYHRALRRKRHLVANRFYHWEDLEVAIELGSARILPGEPPEIVRLVEQMLAKLKPRQRAAVEMTYYEGLTAAEIADRLNESVHAIRHDLHRGIARLRAAVESENENS